jgi:RNA polymerase sigma factor (sigma-70 family)
MPDSTTEDLQLWLQLKQGDEKAFGCLFEKYHASLYNYGHKISHGNQALVEDAVQDLFINLWRLRGGLTEKVESVRFYLYRSLRRRLALAHPSTTPLSDIPLEQQPIEACHEHRLLRKESDSTVSYQLKRLIDELPDRQKEALTLRYYEGFRIAEIAAILQIDEKSVRNALYKALQQLRRHQRIFSETHHLH